MDVWLSDKFRCVNAAVERVAMKLGCIADDFTGATDLASELASRGLRTSLLFGIPAAAEMARVDAVVIALKSRSIAAEAAAEQSVAALHWLKQAGCERFYFKYCSTFDSTDQGNIGPVLEVMAAEVGAQAVIACPAFPATGRTVYQGHLFVGDRLLSESTLRDHPLNPMRDADLVRVLKRQMSGAVGLLPHDVIAAGRTTAMMAQHREAGMVAVIADAICDDDLASLGQYCAGVPLASGASGLASGIARALAPQDAGRASAPLPEPGAARRAILAGSCSAATRRQVELAAEVYPAYRLSLDAGETPQDVIIRAKDWIAKQAPDSPLLIYSTAAPDMVEAQRRIWPTGASAAFEAILAEIAAHLFAESEGALVVAGGETSGAVVSRLGLDRIDIGPEIDPGVPWTIAARHDGPPLLLALKSGNFGSDDFFLKAWEHFDD